MRVVLDTNVLVSGILSPHGPPGRILDLVLSGHLTLLHDDRILAEYDDVLHRPAFNFEPSAVASLLNFIEFSGEHILSRPIAITLPDPSDLPFLEVALAGLADALVTGNARHFSPARGKHNVRVVAPADLIRSIQQ